MSKYKFTRKSFIKIATAVPFLGGAISSCGDDDGGGSSEREDVERENAKYEILDNVKTTFTETFKEGEFTRDETLMITDIKAVLDSNYGSLIPTVGETHILDKSLLKDPDSYTDATERKSLLFFPQITDIHITDVQSPMRAVYGFIIGNGSAYRPQSVYSTHVLNSMVQTFNAIHKKEKFNCVVATGDMIDNAENIEMEWFNTVLNGGVIRADSGDIEDPVSGSGNDFTDPYVTEGLADDLPWYASLGNHDVLFVGINYITDEKAEKYISNEINKTNLGCEIYTGTQDATTKYGDPQCAFATHKTNQGKTQIVPVGTEKCEVPEYGECDKPLVASDSKRTPFRNHGEIVEDIKDGGGFNQENTDVQKGYYSVRPDLNIPIEFIFLDLSATKKHFIKDNVMTPNQVLTNALLGQEQFNWLKNKLDELKEEGAASIIFQHQPTDHFQSVSEISSEEYILLLKQYEDVLSVIAGHTHKNKIRHFNAENEGEYPLVEVVTCGLLDFPEQSRIYEVVYNNNGTISLFTTMLNHASKDNSFSSNARRLALAYTQVDKGFGDYGLGTIDDRNREIILPISTKLQAKLESLTTQAGYVKSQKID